MHPKFHKVSDIELPESLIGFAHLHVIFVYTPFQRYIDTIVDEMYKFKGYSHLATKCNI